MNDHIMQFFAYNHLPQRLQDISRDFCILAEKVALNIPRNPERSVALRKLLEAKDAAVRAVLAEEPEPSPSNCSDQSVPDRIDISIDPH